MTPVRILDLCKGMNSWNAGECMPCLNVLRPEQNKTKPKNKAPNPSDALWVCKTRRTLALADNVEAVGAAQGNVFL